jgi:hypothetical protein
LPAAVNCWFVPAAIDGLTGLTVIEVKEAAVTLMFVDPVMEPDLAEIVVDPVAVTNPDAETVANAGAEEAQVAELVRSFVLPSL